MQNSPKWRPTRTGRIGAAPLSDQRKAKTCIAAYFRPRFSERRFGHWRSAPGRSTRFTACEQACRTPIIATRLFEDLRR
jgi:hypothetical protein